MVNQDEAEYIKANYGECVAEPCACRYKGWARSAGCTNWKPCKATTIEELALELAPLYQRLKPEHVVEGKSDQLYLFLYPHQFKSALAAGYVMREGNDLVLNMPHRERAIICSVKKIPVTA